MFDCKSRYWFFDFSHQFNIFFWSQTTFPFETNQRFFKHTSEKFLKFKRMAAGFSQLHLKNFEIRTSLVLWLFIRLAISSDFFYCRRWFWFQILFCPRILCIQRRTSTSITVACTQKITHTKRTLFDSVCTIESMTIESRVVVDTVVCTKRMAKRK